MSNLKIGVASVTFRNKTIAETVEIAVKAGVDCIEWGADVHVKNIDDAVTARNLCDEKGIKISSYGSYYRAGCGDSEKWAEICSIADVLGAKSIRVWLGSEDSENYTAEEYNDLLADLRSMCDAAAEYGILVCPECHDNTYNNNTDSIIKLKNDLQRDNFKTYFQSRYFRFDYDIDRIERTISFIENVHVSYRDLKKEQMFRKKDKLYLDKLINKLLSVNFGGIVIIEFVDGSKEKSFIADVNKLRKF